MHIISLLPSTTEIVAALGKQDQLVGRSHECDFPKEVTTLPACTKPKFNPDGKSYEIDQRIKARLQEGLSIYHVDEDQLTALNPDVIITQDHCEVCAASIDEVKKAVQSRIGDHVEVISVSPTDLSSVVDSIRTIGEAIETDPQPLMNQMKSKLQAIQQKTIELRHPNILALEWLEPLMAAGNWMPQLVQLAGGQPLGAKTGHHSPKMEWQEVQRLDPDIITIMPCGYTIEQTLAEIETLTSRNGWADLRAVKNKQVFVLDGHQYFNRPGPRLVDSTQILGEIIHPSIFRKENTHREWINLAEYQFHQTIENLT